MSEHLGGCMNPDHNLIVPKVWDAIIESTRCHSMLDVGCGYGWSMEYFHGRGVSVRGIEAHKPAIYGNRLPEAVRVHDYTFGPALPDDVWFDVCWCCEFVEHVASAHEPNFLRDFEQCGVVYMTHATPGQGGWHHVNEQPAEYWISKMSLRGFIFDWDESKRLRAMYSERPYGIPSLLVFKQ